MLVFGTEMHIITLIFCIIEAVLLCFQILFFFERPGQNEYQHLNIILLILLLTYNISSGLFPDPNIPIPLKAQEIMAYCGGFLTPAFFPYYVYKSFNLEKMKYHAYYGVYFFLILPFLLFSIVYIIYGDLAFAQNLLVLPLLYSVFVIYSLNKSIKYKFGNEKLSRIARQEALVMYISLSPWVIEPIIDYFNWGQDMEALVTNSGFLVLILYNVKLHINALRESHFKLYDSEKRLLNLNDTLSEEVKKRTIELEEANKNISNTFVNLSHEMKTPLTLVSNYLTDYIGNAKPSLELNIIHKNVEKIKTDIINYFDIFKVNSGKDLYSHDTVLDVSAILIEKLILFDSLFKRKKNIELSHTIENDLYIKADLVAIDRVFNNILENAFKYTPEYGNVSVELYNSDSVIYFIVEDNGVGIPSEYKEKIFVPYFQIQTGKRNFQGMGLGLPIVKNIIDSLKGTIEILDTTSFESGTFVKIILPQYLYNINHNNNLTSEIGQKGNEFNINQPLDMERRKILIVEDNYEMIEYLNNKLSAEYETFLAYNGKEALAILAEQILDLPHLILSDVMMDEMDGFELIKILQQTNHLKHIPLLFLSAKNTMEFKLLGLESGAIDFISKPFTYQELSLKIRSILSQVLNYKMAIIRDNFSSINKHAVTNEVLNKSRKNADVLISNLTKREIEIANLICQGISYPDIAVRLFISPSTVTKHVQHIFEKMEVNNKIQLFNKFNFN